MIGGQRKQNALYGWAPSEGASGTESRPNGKGGYKTVTKGSVIDNGGNMKHGLFPTVGVSVAFLNLITQCCGKEMCFNTVGPVAAGCNVDGNIFANCSRGVNGSNCR
tara:strand:- start:117 stop:437 length:321 start_codon:yes stop_codon:yes gene_type:complete